MTVAASRPVRDDGLRRTTLRIGAGRSTASIAAIVSALQRVPGVLTVQADTAGAEALVAHDAAVPLESLVAAVKRAASTVMAVAIDGNGAERPATSDTPQTLKSQPLLTVVGLAAVFAIVVIDITQAGSPERRWLFIIPVVVLWAFVLLRTMLARRS